MGMGWLISNLGEVEAWCTAPAGKLEIETKDLGLEENSRSSGREARLWNGRMSQPWDYSEVSNRK